MSFPIDRHPKQALFDSLRMDITLGSPNQKAPQTFVLLLHLKEDRVNTSWSVSHTFAKFKELHKAINFHAPGFIFTEFPPSHHKTGLGLKLSEKQLTQRLSYLIQWFREVIANFDLFPPVVQDMLVQFVEPPDAVLGHRAGNASARHVDGIARLYKEHNSSHSHSGNSPVSAGHEPEISLANVNAITPSGSQVQHVEVSGLVPILSARSRSSSPARSAPKVKKLSPYFYKLYPFVDTVRALLEGAKPSDVSVVCISANNRVITSSVHTPLGDFVHALRHSPVRYCLLVIVVILCGSSAHDWASRGVCWRLWLAGLATALTIWYADELTVVAYNQMVIDKLGVREATGGDAYPYSHYFHSVPLDVDRQRSISVARIQAMLRHFLRMPNLVYADHVAPFPLTGEEEALLESMQPNKMLTPESSRQTSRSASRSASPSKAYGGSAGKDTSTRGAEVGDRGKYKEKDRDRDREKKPSSSLSNMMRSAFHRKDSKNQRSLERSPSSSTTDLVGLEHHGAPNSAAAAGAAAAAAFAASLSPESASTGDLGVVSPLFANGTGPPVADLALPPAHGATHEQVDASPATLSAERRAEWFAQARQTFESFVPESMSEQAANMYKDRRYDHHVTVRGANYMEDQQKIKGGPCLCKLMLMELYEVEQHQGERHDHVAIRGRALRRREAIAALPGNPFQLILNFQIPGDPPVSMVCFFAIPPDVREPGYRDYVASEGSPAEASSSSPPGPDFTRFMSLVDRFLEVPASEKERLAAWGVHASPSPDMSFSMGEGGKAEATGGVDDSAGSDGSHSRHTSHERLSVQGAEGIAGEESCDESGSDTGMSATLPLANRRGANAEAASTSRWKMPSDISWPNACDAGALPPEDFRNQRFKLIPMIMEGPWVVKAAVRSKPALLGRKIVQRYFRGDGYVEIDFDVGSSIIASQIVGVCRGYGKLFVCDVGVVIQGEEPYELPERMLCCGSFNKVDMDIRLKLDE